MYRRILVVAAALLCFFSVSGPPARADSGAKAVHPNIAVGFHELNAPLGVRWWFGEQKVGIDFGIGYHSSDASVEGYPDERLTGWAIDVGVPIVLKSWPRVHAIFRPGILYESQQFEDDPLTPGVFNTEDEKFLGISAEIEAEAFLLENFSVSASTGIMYESVDPPFGGEKQTFFEIHGNEFTNVGFHLYLFH